MMERENANDVLFTAYEYAMARLERTIKRLIIALIITIILLFASNAMWLYEWNQYDYSGFTIDSTEGNANYLEAGADGVINNGESGGQEEGTQK